MPKLVMLKWHLFSLQQYDAIFFADQDVDLMPLETDPDRVRAAWKTNVCVWISF